MREDGRSGHSGTALPGGDPATPALLPAHRQLLWAALAVLVGVPAVLGLWIGLVLLADRIGVDMSANQVFAWILATIVALLLWPLMVRALNRWFWHRRTRPDDAVGPGTRTAPPPRVPLGAGTAALRIAVLVIGALALLLVCGPQEVAAAISGAIGSASAGPASAWALVQLGAFLLTMALLLPVLLLTDRVLRRTPADSPDRLAVELRQNWYAAAATAWAAAAVMGFLFANLVLQRL